MKVNNNIVGTVVVTGVAVGAGVAVYMNRDKIKETAKTAVSNAKKTAKTAAFNSRVNTALKGLKHLEKIRLSGKKPGKKDVAYATSIVGYTMAGDDSGVLEAAIEKAKIDGVDFDALTSFAKEVYVETIEKVASSTAKIFADEFGEDYEADFDLEKIMKDAAEFAASLHNDTVSEEAAK